MSPSLPRRLAALTLVLAACAAEAGPCASCAPAAPAGWWDDRPLAAGDVADEAPRIDVDGTGLVSRAAIAWERRSGGDGDVWLAVSDDGGCSWSQQAVTGGPEDDRLPDVAVSLARDAVALTFVRDGIVFATTSSDGGRTFAPPEAVDPRAPTDATSRPRLGMIATGAELHLHVAWTEGGRLRLARNLASGAPGAWLAGPPLSDALESFSAWTSSDVAADTRSFDPATASAVTLVASGLASGSTVTEVFALRSNDSGATFFGDPATPATRDVPRRVSEPRASADPARSATRPVLDVSDDGSGEFYTWEAVGYSDAASGELVRGDARAEEGVAPTTVADWNDSSVEDLVIEPAARAAGVSVIPNPLQRPPAPEAWFFAESEASGATEIVALRTALDTATAGWIAPTCGARRLTGEAPARAAGQVVPESLSSDEDLSHVFVAWADTRDGGSSIYWKRTDSATAPATAVAAGPGDCATGGGIAATWTLPADPPHCDVARVRIEWSDSPGGLDGSVDVAPTPPAQVTGFPDRATLWVRVVVVDEACNEAPSAEVAAIAATCGAVAPPNPVGGSVRAARAPSRDDVALTWAAPPVDAAHDAATSYDVYRSVTRARDGFALLAAPAPTALVDRGAAAAGTARLHFYLVVSRNSAGTSGDEPLP